MKGWLVDSDIWIDALRGHAAAQAWLEAEADAVEISAATVAELFAGARTPRKQREVERLLEPFPPLPLDGDLARRAGRRVAALAAKGINIGLVDGINAELALATERKIATGNLAHYPGVPAAIPYPRG